MTINCAKSISIFKMLLGTGEYNIAKAEKSYRDRNDVGDEIMPFKITMQRYHHLRMFIHRTHNRPIVIIDAKQLEKNCSLTSLECHFLLDFSNCKTRVESLWTGPRTIQNCVAPVQAH